MEINRISYNFDVDKGTCQNIISPLAYGTNLVTSWIPAEQFLHFFLILDILVVKVRGTVVEEPHPILIIGGFGRGAAFFIVDYEGVNLHFALIAFITNVPATESLRRW